MKVSIAMATYNGAKYLQEQLDSFISQTHPPDELVISDDCSRDDTIKIITEFIKVSPFPVILMRNNINIGYKYNFAQAISKCTGDIIFLSDQDDVWFPSKIKTVKELFFKENNIMVITTDEIITDEKLNHNNNSRLDNLRFLNKDSRHHVAGCCTAMRKIWASAVLPIPQAINAHDTWIATLADKVNSREIVSIPLQFYRRHDSNASQSISYSIKRINKIKSSPYKIIIQIIRDLYHNKKNLADEIHVNQAYSDRLLCIKSSIKDNHIRDRIDFFLRKNSHHINSLSERHRILQLPFYNKFFEVIKYYFKGGYKHFNGIYSALRDLAS